jgi:hypothetical protein
MAQQTGTKKKIELTTAVHLTRNELDMLIELAVRFKAESDDEPKKNALLQDSLRLVESLRLKAHEAMMLQKA